MTTRHLVLAGAGHAQLDLLAALSRTRLSGWTVTLVTPEPEFHYSGMLPGIIAGRLAPEDARIPVAAIARHAGITVRLGAVSQLDPARRVLTLRDGSTVSFDLLSLDVGSAPAGQHVPGALAHAFAMRPFGEALRLIARLDAVLARAVDDRPVPVVVVGAGAAGVEVALALRARILRAGRTPEVTIIDPRATASLPLPGFSLTARERSATMLHRRQVRVLAGVVTEVQSTALLADVAGDLQFLASCATAWVAGPAAPPWLAASGVACDPAGYPLVSDTLALDDTDTMFGGGDCVTLRSASSRARSGVYAVRMAPVLAANVLAAARGRTARESYTAQRSALALLSTGDNGALLHWRSVTLESRWAQRLKTFIDTRYVRRYRASAP